MSKPRTKKRKKEENLFLNRIREGDSGCIGNPMPPSMQYVLNQQFSCDAQYASQPFPTIYPESVRQQKI